MDPSHDETVCCYMTLSRLYCRKMIKLSQIEWKLEMERVEQLRA